MRKKILNAAKKAELELEDAHYNALLQAFVQSREINSLKNKRRFKINDGPSRRSSNASSIKISEIDINMASSGGNIGMAQGSDMSPSFSMEDSDPRKQVYIESDYSSYFLEDSYVRRVMNKRDNDNMTLNRLNNKELHKLKSYFDESSVEAEDSKAREHRAVLKEGLKTAKKARDKDEEDSELSNPTSIEDFFPQKNSVRSEDPSLSESSEVSTLV